MKSSVLMRLASGCRRHSVIASTMAVTPQHDTTQCYNFSTEI